MPVVKIIDEVAERGVRERAFTLDHDGRTIPGIAWTPAADPAHALVLIGHGGGLHKRAPYVLSLARRLVRHHAIAAVAIDGPHHGDRPAPPAPTTPDATLPTAWWSEQITNETTRDWQATLAAARALPEVGDVPAGYWGFSMGTIFGLPFVAAEPQITVAVLGLMGIVGPTKDLIERAARSLTIPLLFVLQWDDELFSRAAGLALFDAFGTADKRLHVNPGAHSAVPADEFEATEAFLAKHLLA